MEAHTRSRFGPDVPPIGSGVFGLRLLCFIWSWFVLTLLFIAKSSWNNPSSQQGGLLDIPVWTGRRRRIPDHRGEKATTWTLRGQNARERRRCRGDEEQREALRRAAGLAPHLSACLSRDPHPPRRRLAPCSAPASPFVSKFRRKFDGETGGLTMM